MTCILTAEDISRVRSLLSFVAQGVRTKFLELGNVQNPIQSKGADNRNSGVQQAKFR
jgi:hypothetical protein